MSKQQEQESLTVNEYNKMAICIKFQEAMDDIESQVTMCLSNDHEEILEARNTVRELFDSLPPYETMSDEKKVEYEYMENYAAEFFSEFEKTICNNKKQC